MKRNLHRMNIQRIVMTAVLCVGTAAALWSQNEPSGGDEPLRVGEAAILYQEAPEAPARRHQGEQYLRAAIIPMSTPDAPVRIRFEKGVDLSKVRNSSDLSLRISFPYSGRSVSGKWEWKDSQEVHFVFNQPPSVGTYVSVTVSGRVTLQSGNTSLPVYSSLEFVVENFMMGTKTNSRPVVPGKPAFVAVLNSGTGRVGNGPLHLLYDQPVNHRDLAAMIEASSGTEMIPVEVYKPDTIFFDPEGRYETSHVVAIRFSELPPDRATVKLKYPLEAVSGTESFAEASYTVFTDFRWSGWDFERLQRGTAARLSNEWELYFNSPIDPVLFEESFSISPAPNYLTLRYYDRSVYIRADFDIGRTYSMELSPDFIDALGNRLQNPISFAFKSQDLTPIFEVPVTPLVLETGTNRLPVKYRNLRDITIRTYTFDGVGNFIRSLAANDPYAGNVRSSPGDSISVRPEQNTINQFYQADFGIGTEPGLKRLDIQAAGRGTEAEPQYSKSILLQSTNIGISAKVSDGAVFVWATRMSNTLPINGAKVRLFSASAQQLGEAVTDARGIAQIKSSHAIGTGLEAPLFVSVESGADTAVCRLINSEMSSPWQFNIPGAVKGVNPLGAAVFTERGVYRPGESVYVKAFIRDLPEYEGLSSVNLSIRDSRGREVYSTNRGLDAYRGSAWEYRIPADAPVGEYSAAVSLGMFTTYISFNVEEYRVPSFFVTLGSPTQNWVMGSTVVMHAAAEYFRGGALGNKAVSWSVYRQPETFTVSRFPGYVFTLERDPNMAGTVYDGGGRLSPEGSASILFTPTHPDSYGPMRYIVQASVTDDDRQTYAGRVSQIVHATELYVGLQPPAKQIYRSGEPVEFPFVVTDTQGNILPGREVKVFVDVLRYNQNTMLDEAGRTATYNRQVISTHPAGSVVSGTIPKQFSVTRSGAGYYRLRMECKDGNGRTASTAFIFTVTGDGTVAWPRYDRERIDLILDKETYKAGDQATVVVKSPFETARGLLTVEVNGVLDAYPFTIDKNTPAITFPVKASYVPNAYVSVILVRGRVHYAKDATGFETGAPAYRIGYSRFEVEPEAQRLAMSINNTPISAGPGENVSVTFNVRTPSGGPSDASAAVMVVDEAVLGLTGFRTPDPVKLAYSFRALSMRNASNLLDLPHSRRSRFEALFPAGDSDDPAMLSYSDDILRRLFKSTAFYAPAVRVGPEGRGTFSFTLPDNLTTYRIMVVAVNKNGQMGSAQGVLETRKDLVIEPVLPRFVYEEDSFTIQARVFNRTDTDGDATVRAAFRGVNITGSAAPVRIRVRKKDSAMASYSARVIPGEKNIRVQLSAAMGALSDGSEYDIPVRVRGNKQQTLVNMVANGREELTLNLPAQRTPGTIEISVSGTPLSELRDAIDYLMEYPTDASSRPPAAPIPWWCLRIFCRPSASRRVPRKSGNSLKPV
uniref:Alpha-2-macroglobulin family protein n=1 Tax=Breznakiella homolactica TaxID=2798577 RepID=A0A7T7XN01_9SPIR